MFVKWVYVWVWVKLKYRNNFQLKGIIRERELSRLCKTIEAIEQSADSATCT